MEKPRAQASPASMSRYSVVSPVIPAQLTQGTLKLGAAEAHGLSWCTYQDCLQPKWVLPLPPPNSSAPNTLEGTLKVDEKGMRMLGFISCV